MVSTLVATGSPLVQELQQGRKMRSLDALMSKLDEDQHRHAVHAGSVQEGMATVNSAQAMPDLMSCGLQPQGLDPLPKRISYPEMVRAQVSAARAGSPAGGAAAPTALGSALVPSSPPSPSSPSQPATKAAGPRPSPPAEPRGSPPPPSRSRLLQDAGREPAAGTAIPRPPDPPQPEPPPAASVGSGDAQGGSPATGADSADARGSAVADLGLSAEGFRRRVGRGAPEPESGHRSGDEPESVVRTAARGSVCPRPSLELRSPMLRRAQDRRDSVLAHSDEVLGLAFSPDGRQLFAGGEDGSAVLWDAATGLRLAQVKVAFAVTAVAYSPSGLYLAAGGASSVSLWGAAAQQEVGVSAVEGEARNVALASSPRELLAVGTTAKKVVLFAVPGLERLVDLRHDGHVSSVAFSPDGGLLAAGGGTDHMHGLMTRKPQGDEMAAAVWEVPAQGGGCKHLGSILFDDLVHATAFSPSGKLLAAAGESRVIATLLVEQGFEKASELACAAGVRCLAWSPDSRFLASAGEDLQVSVWDVLRERVVLQLPKAQDWVCGVAFSADGTWLAACDFATHGVILHAIEVLDWAPESVEDADGAGVAAVPDGQAEAPQQITLLVPETSPASAGAVVPLGEFATGFKLLASASEGRCPSLAMDTEHPDTLMAPSNSREVKSLRHEDDVMSLAFSPDGSHVAAGGEDATLVVWSVRDGSRVMEAKLGHGVTAVAYAPSGIYVAAADAGEGVTLFIVETEEEAGSATLESEVLALALSAGDKGLLAAGLAAKRVALLSVPDLDEIADLRHDGAVRSLSFSPCGGLLAGGGGTDDMHGLMTKKAEGRPLRAVVWQVAPESDGCQFVGSMLFDDVVHATAFSPSGGLLAIGGEDRRITALNARGSFERAWELHCAAGVRCLAWSADSRFLVSGGEDMRASVWDVAEQMVLFQLPKVSDWISSVAFSPDGQWLAYCGFGNSTVALQPVEMLSSAEAAERLATPSSRRTRLLSKEVVNSLIEGAPVELDHATGTSSRTIAVPSVVGLGGASEGFHLEVHLPAGASSSGGPDLMTRIAARRSVAERNSLTASVLLGVKLVPTTMRLCEARQKVALAHADEVMCLVFSPCGSRLLAAGEDATLIVWDVEQAAKTREISLRDPAVAVAYAPSGELFAAGTAASRVIVWQAENHEEVGDVGTEGEVLSLALASKPKELLAIGTTAKKVMLVTLPGLEPLAELRHDGHVHSVAFCPQGGMLAGGGGTDGMHGLMTKKTQGCNMKTVVWQVAATGDSCKYLGSISFDDIVHATTFSPSGKLLAVAGENRMIAVLLVDRSFEKASELACAAGVRCLAWSPDSRFLASGGEDLQVSVWDILAERVVLQLPKAKDWVVSVSFSPDARWLAYCGFGGSEVVLHPVSCAAATLQEHDASDSEARGSKTFEEEPPASPRSASSLPPPKQCEVFKSAGTVKFDARLSEDGTAIVPSPCRSVVRLGSSSDGFKLQVSQIGASSGQDLLTRMALRKSIAHSQKLVSLMLGMEVRPLKIRQCQSRPSVELPHGDEVMALAFSPDGRGLVAGGEDATLVLWDVETKTRVIEAKVEQAIMAVAYSSSGQYVAAAHGDRTLSVWSTSTKEQRGTELLEGEVLSLAMVSRPQEVLAAGTTAKKVMLLSVPELAELAELRHDGHVHCVTFSPDGAMLAGGGGTDEMHGLMTKKQESAQMKTVLWQVSSDGGGCKYLGSITFDNIVHATAFSPSGKLLAVGGESCMIATFLVDREFEKASELPCAAGVRCLAWSPNSRFLASGGEDLQVSVWDLIAESVVLQLPKEKDWLCAVAFSPDSLWLATCGYGSGAVALHAVEVFEEESGPHNAGEESDQAVEELPLVSLQMAVPDVGPAAAQCAADEHEQPLANLRMAVPEIHATPMATMQVLVSRAGLQSRGTVKLADEEEMPKSLGVAELDQPSP